MSTLLQHEMHVFSVRMLQILSKYSNSRPELQHSQQLIGKRYGAPSLTYNTASLIWLQYLMQKYRVLQDLAL